MTERASLRVAMFGSPAFAVDVLEALAGRHEVVLAVAQPDKPAGRGLGLRPPPLAEAARALGIPLEQPRTLRRNSAFRNRLESSGAEVAVTAAYGKILPPDLLGVPPHGFLNVHASLLPKYRGAAPVQWALIRGETRTGVTIMQTNAGLDTGPIRLQRSRDVDPHETAADLFPALARLGVAALLEALDLLVEDALPLEPQDDAEATHAPLLDREDGRLVWDRSASACYDRYRGVFVWPGTWFEHAGTTIKVHEMRPVNPDAAAAAPGEVLAVRDDGVHVATGAGAVLLGVVQPASRGRVHARDWANGYGITTGVVLA